MSKFIIPAVNPIIQFDSKLMPTYKNVSWMLKMNWVVEPDVLITQKKGENTIFNPKANVFLHLKTLARQHVEGYGIIRVKNKKQAKFLEAQINKRIRGKHVFVKHWNQGNQLDPEKYFNEIREGVFVVVIVQRKAAMGNSMSTEHVRFVYDYSPTAALSTIAQGLLGRCCGHGKKKHHVIVYTHLNHAIAFSLFEQGRLQEFYAFLALHGIKPSQRSRVYKKSVPIFHGVIKPKKKIENRDEARAVVLKELKDNFGDNLHVEGLIATRFLEKQKNGTQRKWYLDQISKGLNPVSTRSIEKAVGKTALFFDHRTNSVYFGHRIEGSCEYALGAKDKSLYTQL
ncbi:MAG: hypothetical protein ISR65_19875 [Bacteriovoracaceae bacterium]|nr:hypothetical protein [Candidatus Brocadiales bacterium]MBL6992052.1 hypothetical protein [Bacteriovoracaceae bacterium]